MNKKCLLHVCCAPCSVYPLKILKKKFDFIACYFYGNNIHPFTEYIKRRDAVIKYADYTGLRLIINKEYNLKDFIQKIVFREEERCSICYYERLKSSAKIAKKGKFNCFTTSLLYSKFQKHERIKSIGKAVGKEIDVPFYYEDFRCGWSEGVQESKKLNLYRQKYCGCIYSEQERYYKQDDKGNKSY
jgi:predicted adenine nucleotide alpha hydrolase (AANH) superfamily ATPase